jgi:nitroimidazol reductase NimA-like FMN-containing flavoprotein (pyridoxamine 5'-phosphate oxidase superfamily)
MRSAECPLYEWHKRQHSVARAAAARLARRIQRGDREASLERLNYFAGWLKNHIRLSDHMLGAYIWNYERERTAQASSRVMARHGGEPAVPARLGAMETYAPTDHTQVKRLPHRGVYDQAEVHAILDEGLVCHVGFVADGQPYVIPTLYARSGDEIYIHGSAASRMLRALAQGAAVCLTVTLVDGFVLARSVFHHSMNYRSVVVLGKARLVSDAEEKAAALRCFTNRMAAGRWEEARQPTEQELKSTTVLALPLEEVSAKVRTGPPLDDEDDYALPVWAGVVPIRQKLGEPVADPRLPADVPVFDKSRLAPRRK